MSKKTISIRVPTDTHDRFEKYRAENAPDDEELTKADAGRQLLEAGLESRGLPRPDGGARHDIEAALKDYQRQTERVEGVRTIGFVAAAVGIVSAEFGAFAAVPMSATALLGVVVLGLFAYPEFLRRRMGVSVEHSQIAAPSEAN